MANDIFDRMNDPERQHDGLFFGKYRGMVKDNIDPEKMGRILATVPAVPGLQLNWALPCSPYAGDQVGFYTIPPIGARVWIEFEGGNPNFPIWSGCFWHKDEVPKEMKKNSTDPSQVKVFKTRVLTVWIDDTDKKGQVVLEYKDAKLSKPVTVNFTMDASGLVIKVQGSKGTSTIKMDPQLIQSDSEKLATNSTKNTEMTAKADFSATASKNMLHKATTKATVQSAQVEVKGSAAVTIKGGMVKIN